jgi:methionyl-tRNA formyltransferase
MKIVFMGSAEFGLPALEKIYASDHEIVGIVSTPPRRKGRGLKSSDSPIADWAKKKGAGPILLPEDLKSQDFYHSLKVLNGDLFVVVAFKILPRDVFSLPRLGTINIHASLLPKYRGPAPIQRAIQAGEKKTGITIFRIDAGIDTGNIIVQKSLDIGDLETTPELYEKLSQLGAQSLIEAITILQNGSRLMVQDVSGATAAPKLRKPEGKLDWTKPAVELFNMLRAFKPFPGTYTFLEGTRLTIEWALPVNFDGGIESGAVCSIAEEYFDVQCLGSVLRVYEVKPEGRKNMSAKAFMMGRKLTVGTRFS